MAQKLIKERNIFDRLQRKTIKELVIKRNS